MRDKLLNRGSSTADAVPYTSIGLTVMVRAESSQSISFSLPFSWSLMVRWWAARILNTPRIIIKTRKLTHTTMTIVAALGTTASQERTRKSKGRHVWTISLNRFQWSVPTEDSGERICNLALQPTNHNEQSVKLPHEMKVNTILFMSAPYCYLFFCKIKKSLQQKLKKKTLNF